MKDLSNSYLGQYYLTEIIGRGSTSVVYKAYQSSLDRYVAVKVLLHHLDKQYAARFIREAHAVAQLQHPNILPIYDYGEQLLHAGQNEISVSNLADGAFRRPPFFMLDHAEVRYSAP